MIEREILIQELWSRLSSVSGVTSTARNPKKTPSVEDFPCIQFFELNDLVIKESSRGGYPIYLRNLEVAIDSYMKATSEQSATKELGLFVQEVKKKIYQGGVNLGRKCQIIKEVESSRVLRPPVGENSIGLGLAFNILYTEEIGKLFI